MTNARDKANIPVLNFQSKGIDDNASSTAVTILSDGKIGIGTVNPVRELHVDGSTSSIAIGKNGSGSATLRFYSDGSQKSYIQLDPSENMVYYAPSGTEQQFYASGSEKMRLTGTGLGVGTSSPAKRFHVHGSGSEIARFEATGGSSFIGIKDADDGTIAYIGVDAGKLKFETSGSGFSDKLVIDTAGNVGIGETAPLGLLHVKSGDSGASVNSGHNQVIAENSGNSGMTILSGTSSNGAICYGDSGNNCIGYINYAHNGNHLDFGVNNAERMRIDSSGNVAIGHTTSGGSKLAICDGANAQIQFFPEISTDTNLIQHYDPTASAYMASDNRASQYLFKIGTTEKVRIDSSGNVGINNTVASTINSANGTGNLVVGSGSGTEGITIYSGTTGEGTLQFADASTGAGTYVGQINYNHSNNFMSFGANGAERMRFDSNGSMLIGTASEPTGSTGGVGFINDSSSRKDLICASTSTGTVELIEFRNPNGTVGVISTSGSNTNYGTSSDYRLKENVVEIEDATARLKKLKPKRFNFIADANTTVDGFIAHEVSSVVPEAISGEKDAVKTKEKVVINSNGEIIANNIEQADWEVGKIADENGNTQYPTDSTWEATKVVPVYQGIDQSKLVPLLVKTIQELEARITTLEANNP